MNFGFLPPRLTNAGLSFLEIIPPKTDPSHKVKLCWPHWKSPCEEVYDRSYVEHQISSTISVKPGFSQIAPESSFQNLPISARRSLLWMIHPEITKLSPDRETNLKFQTSRIKMTFPCQNLCCFCFWPCKPYIFYSLYSFIFFLQPFAIFWKCSLNRLRKNIIRDGGSSATQTDTLHTLFALLNTAFPVFTANTHSSYL